MRNLIFTLSVLLVSLVNAQNTNVTFRSKTTYTGQTLSNIWGYAAGGKEYALVGAKNGMIVMDVTNPAAPVQIVQIAGPSSQWREIKTYGQYAYIATEGGGGLQIVDLSPLPNSNLTVYTYTGGGTTPAVLNSIHALHVDETAGFLYLYGSNLVGGRACVFNLSPDPTAPVYEGYYNPIGYAHDGYVDNNIMYAAHINAGKVSIVDMTDKSNPTNQIGVDLAAPFTTPFAFSHNTWVYGNTLFTTDEKPSAPLAAYDITDLNDIVLLDQVKSSLNGSSIVHNTYIRDGYAITSWYIDGMTIVDANRPDNLVQVGNYDTYTNTGTGFNGAWGVYPYLPSGNILVSNISGTNTTSGEMFVLTPTYQRACYVEGLVTNAVTGNPVAAATVELISTTTTTTSNSFGDYKMGQLATGNYILKVSKPGYDVFSQTISLATGAVTNVNVALQPASCSYVTHNSNNFETSLGIWTDGGTDCARVNNSAFANSVPYSMQLRDNTTTSLMTTTNQNCAAFSEMQVSFSYVSSSFDNANEDFWLQVSTNGGTTFTTVADYNYSIEFINGSRKNVTVTIPGPFTNTTKFRFRADASADDDNLYIDDVVIKGCLPPSITNDGNDEVNNTTPSAQWEEISEVKTGPNPASQSFLVQFKSESETNMEYVVLDLSGQLALEGKLLCAKGHNELNLNMSKLQKGAYIFSMRTPKSRYTQKLMISRD
jgi:choice-of-anchor B domain-containing protein